jgi:hypothetical protein
MEYANMLTMSPAEFEQLPDVSVGQLFDNHIGEYKLSNSVAVHVSVKANGRKSLIFEPVQLRKHSHDL